MKKIYGLLLVSACLLALLVGCSTSTSEMDESANVSIPLDPSASVGNSEGVPQGFLSGDSVGSDSAAVTRDNETVQNNPSDTKAQQQTSVQIGRKEAKNIALTAAGVSEKEISYLQIELDYDDDIRRWKYEIGFYVGNKEVDVDIDAATGTVLKREIDGEKQPVATSGAKIGYDAAKAAALKKAGVNVNQISDYESELDYDDDARRWEYEISFRVGRMEYECEIHAETGAIIRFEKEIDD